MPLLPDKFVETCDYVDVAAKQLPPCTGFRLYCGSLTKKYINQTLFLRHCGLSVKRAELFGSFTILQATYSPKRQSRPSRFTLVPHDHAAPRDVPRSGYTFKFTASPLERGAPPLHTRCADFKPPSLARRLTASARLNVMSSRTRRSRSAMPSVPSDPPRLPRNTSGGNDLYVGDCPLRLTCTCHSSPLLWFIATTYLAL